MTGKDETPLAVAYAAWLRAAREALGTSAAVVRAMQNRLTPSDLASVHADWASKYGDHDWRSSRYAQWETGRRSIPKQAAIQAALIATVSEVVPSAPLDAPYVGTFQEVVSALIDQRRRSLTIAPRDAASQQQSEHTRNYLSVDPSLAKHLSALGLGLGSWAYDNELPTYIPRTSDTSFIATLQSRTVGLTVIVGPPKSGKTRSVHHVLQHHYPEALVWWANSGPGVLQTLSDRFRSTAAAHKPEVIVLDDAHLCGVNPTDGLTASRLLSLADKVRLIIVIHDVNLGAWVKQSIDRTAQSELGPSSLGATPELVSLLTQNRLPQLVYIDPRESHSSNLT
jgi:hypothetical protein